MIFEFPPSHIDRHSDDEKAGFAKLYEDGERLHRAVYAYAQTQYLNDALSVWLARSPGDRLSQVEIDRYSRELMYARAPREFIDDPAKVLGATQGAVVPVIEAILRADQGARSFLNIGVYLALLDRYLAKQFPEASFTGIDFWVDLMEANALLLLPNMRILRGYALDELAAGRIAGDIVLFFSTATRIKNLELRRYFGLLHSAKYVVLNEPLFPLPTGEIVDPDSVDINRSIPVMIYPIYPGDAGGPYPPALVHNYRALLEEAGFDVAHFLVRHKPTPRVQAVGIRSRSDNRTATV